LPASKLLAFLPRVPVPALGLMIVVSAVQASCSGTADLSGGRDFAEASVDLDASTPDAPDADATPDAPSDDSPDDRADGMSYGDAYGP
jgi:hypothetical protein